MDMSAVNHFHSLTTAFFRNGRNTCHTFLSRPRSILFSSLSVITVRMLDKESNRLDVTSCSFSLTSRRVLIKGLSNLEIAQIVQTPMAKAIEPKNGEK